MKRPGTRFSFAMLAVLTAVSWSVVAWESLAHGMVSLVSIVTALMFVAMMVAWPFLNGVRLTQGQVQRAAMCVECHAPRWPAEKALGFCLNCGSSRPARIAGY